MDEGWKWYEAHDRWAAERFGPNLEDVKAGQVVRRKAEHIHRVILCGGRPAWTLVKTGPYRREWNFVTKDGPVPWRKYLNIPEDKVYGGD
jgi:hypothetical protein